MSLNVNHFHPSLIFSAKAKPPNVVKRCQCFETFFKNLFLGENMRSFDLFWFIFSNFTVELQRLCLVMKHSFSLSLMPRQNKIVCFFRGKFVQARLIFMSKIRSLPTECRISSPDWEANLGSFGLLSLTLPLRYSGSTLL
jgi:hypothetical protein